MIDLAHDAAEPFRGAIQRHVLRHRACGDSGEDIALLEWHFEQTRRIDHVYEVKGSIADEQI